MRTVVVAPANSPACALAQRLIDAAALNVLDQAHTAVEALSMALAMQPELMLLDPGLKPIGAAELAASLHDPAPQLVWLTHDVVRRCLAAECPQHVNAALKRLPRRRMGVEVGHLVVLEEGRFMTLDLADIRWLELPDARHPTLLVLHGFSESHVLRRRLTGLLDDLPPGRMLRCQNRVAVAPAHVLEALPHEKHGATLLLDNGTRLACGPQFWPALQAALQALDTPVASVDQPAAPSRWSAPWRLDAAPSDDGSMGPA
ncbi:MAG TPA: LytTR family transcriptional regulator DNA-binding domain-containing protein [Roseateles sp.]